MSLARLVITAVVVEGRSKSAVAREYRHSRFWVHQLVNRFVAAGETAFEPRSRRPHSSPHAVGLEVEDQIVRLRKTLTKRAGCRRRDHCPPTCSPRNGAGAGGLDDLACLVSARVRDPAAAETARSSWKTFCADQPNERWQGYQVVSADASWEARHRMDGMAETDGPKRPAQEAVDRLLDRGSWMS
jgi:hypothetical protein